MRDFDKIKEKDKKDEFKGMLLIGMIFLVALGIIVYILITLTNQYFDLKTDLENSKSNRQIAMTDPEHGESFEYKLDKSNIKVEKIKKEIEKESTLDFKQDNTTNETAEIKANQEVKKENKKEVKTQKQEPVKAKSSTKKVKPKETKKTTVKKSKNDKKTYVVKPKNNYNYVIQLMAFKNLNSAKKKLNEYKGKLNNLHIVKVDLKNKGTWYRLRCGGYNSYSEAKKELKVISKKYNIKPIVVKNK